MDIYITSKELRPDDLIHRLESTPEWPSSEIQLILRRREQAFRTLDPTIVVAIISAASASLGAFITGLLGVAQGTKAKTIVIQDKDGRRLEFPADSSKEKIEELLELVRQMEGARLEIS